MTNLTTVKDSLAIVDLAGKLLRSSGIAKVGSALAKATVVGKHLNSVGGSIASVSAQTNISARVFIEESVVGEIVLPNLMKTIHEWYAAQILAALQLSQLVTDKKTVQQMLSLVQTGQNERENSAIANLTKEAALGAVQLDERYRGLASFTMNYEGESALESYGPTKASDFIKRLNDEKESLEKENEVLKSGFNSTSVKSVKVSDNRIGPMGELFEVTLTNPTDKNLSIKVPLFIQMQPTIVPQKIAPRFVDLNVPASVWQRWVQWRAGEISFFKDFIMQKDNIERMKTVIKDPSSNAAFMDFQRTIAKKDRYALGDVTDRVTANHSQNLANSVVIFSEETVLQAKSDSGIDLHKDSDRKRYFKNVYAMIIVIVDTFHQRLTIYFNGIDGSLDCTYNDFKPKDAKFEPNDFMAALTAFSSGSIGRLR